MRRASIPVALLLVGGMMAGCSDEPTTECPAPTPSAPTSVSAPPPAGTAPRLRPPPAPPRPPAQQPARPPAQQPARPPANNPGVQQQPAPAKTTARKHRGPDVDWPWEDGDDQDPEACR